MNRRDVVFLIVAVIGVLLDQGSKWWVIENIALGSGEIDLIPGFLSFVHAQNPGAAFGMFRDFEYRHHIFFVFTIIAFGVIADLYRKIPKTDVFMPLVLGLIISGAIGNAIDRARFRYVTDFIRVYTEAPSLRDWLIGTFGTNEWPSFNIADANLVVGVLLFFVYQMFFDESKELSESTQDAPAEPTPQPE